MVSYIVFTFCPKKFTKNSVYFFFLLFIKMQLPNFAYLET